MLYSDENLLKACEKHVKETGYTPKNFSNEFQYDNKTYVYMSEVDPHVDDWKEDNNQKWKIRFHAIEKDFVFVYRNNGKLYQIEPKLDQVYEFEFKKYHALLHKDNLHLFGKRKYWEGWTPEEKLVTIFEFVDD